MTAFYNEHDAYPAQWTRNLIAAGHVAPGVVDERSIKEVQPEDLEGKTQAHFFSGIALWSYALRLAGWPDDEEVWTGSCPCQPFSNAGKRLGTKDKRHLWPAWFKLVKKCRPPVVFGEQVAGPDGLKWFDAVRTDLERAGYAVGVANLCAAGVGAPHIRQRLYFVAYANGRAGGQGREELFVDDHRGDAESQPRSGSSSSSSTRASCGLAHHHHHHHRREVLRGARLPEDGDTSSGNNVDGCGEARGLGHSSSSRSGRDSRAIFGAKAQGGRERLSTRDLFDESIAAGTARGLGNSSVERLEGHGSGVRDEPGDAGSSSKVSPGGPGFHDFWDDIEWLPCRDGKWRPTKPGLFPMADGYPDRVGKLRAIGNAIVPQVAATFIKAFIDCRQHL